MKKQSLNALAASYRADLLYYIERAKLGKCPPHWQAYCFGEIAAAKGTDAYPEDGDSPCALCSLTFASILWFFHSTTKFSCSFTL